jgi:hypothetical protein
MKINKVQIRKIEVEKWNEGCRLQRDPGIEYVFWWIQNYAGWFREAWDRSQCKTCCHWERCGHQVNPDCSDYQKE